jgi:hypothetical protein
MPTNADDKTDGGLATAAQKADDTAVARLSTADTAGDDKAVHILANSRSGQMASVSSTKLLPIFIVGVVVGIGIDTGENIAQQPLINVRASLQSEKSGVQNRQVSPTLRYAKPFG